VLKFGLW